MKHGAVRKLTRAAALSFLVLATTSSVAGLEVLTASSAMADQSPSDGSNPSTNGQEPAQTPGAGSGGTGGGSGLPIIGNVVPGSSALLH